jgi:transcriptional regulator with XRE-family HTH domain
MSADDMAQALESLMESLIQKHQTQKAVAIKAGIEESRFSRKHSGQEGWTLPEIAALLALAKVEIIEADELQALRYFARKGIA